MFAIGRFSPASASTLLLTYHSKDIMYDNAVSGLYHTPVSYPVADTVVGMLCASNKAVHWCIVRQTHLFVCL